MRRRWEKRNGGRTEEGERYEKNKDEQNQEELFSKRIEEIKAGRKRGGGKWGKRNRRRNRRKKNRKTARNDWTRS